ncbi:AAA domain-containing protein [Cohnella sp. GCM10020058]|uniref:AAA domain-containing protein n=1 Tax=Cohnella sp. GCM10020058 TaxID=3317330 RepID=UPI003625DC38
MLLKNLLQYYLECLKYESYYSIQLKQREFEVSQIDPHEISQVYDQYEKMRKKLENEHSIMFGYPILRKGQGDKVSFLPLFLWNSSTFQFDRNIFKADQLGFHQELFKSISDKRSIDAINLLKEQFAADPLAFLQSKHNLQKLLDYSEYDIKSIIPSYVMVQVKNKSSSNYLIVDEIQAILSDKRKPSAVLNSFLGHSYALPMHDTQKEPLHIVPSNYPQNVSLSDIQYTVSMIKGPPGTGKTQTILNLIANQIDRQETCIIASTNNQAVNNITEKLERKGINQQFFGFVRLGSLSHNKNEVIKIQATIERIKKEIGTTISDETYISFATRSKILMKKINQLEQIEQQIMDLTSTIDQLHKLIQTLNDRLHLNYLMTMKSDFEALSISGIRIETRLRELVDEPLQLFGNDIFRKFRSFIAGKIDVYMKQRIKKYLRSIDAPKLWEYIDISKPTHSLALCEEIVKVINLEHRLQQYTDQLLQLQKHQSEQPDTLDDLYKEKNEIDLIIIRARWLRNAKPIFLNAKEMKNIENLLDELSQDGRIRTSASAFVSFVKLFPVLLISSLSARSCIPHGASIDLTIIDESSQCSIPSVFSLLQSSRRVCFFGDIHQLSHITSLEDSYSKILFDKCAPGIEHLPYCFRNISAFERAEQSCLHSGKGMHLLSYHYRCIPSIASFSNQHFYRGQLRMMRQEPERRPFKTGIFSTNVYGFVSGTYNRQEVDEVKAIVAKLEQNGVTQIGIVTPFAAQKNELIKAFRHNSNIKVGTVHAFQGGECRAIIFSTVVSNGSTAFQINFVQNSYRLINVALTRALDYFILVGNLAEIDNAQGFLTKLSQYIYSLEARSFHRPAIELSIEFNRIIRQESRKALMHQGERMIFNKLQIYLGGMPFIVFPKVPIKDVLSVNFKLDSALKSYYFTSHMDFVIYEKESLQPLCSIEYDGDYHRRDSKTIENDNKKDTLCRYADFQQFRIASNAESEGWERLRLFLNSFS